MAVEKRAGRVLAVSPHAPAEVETVAHIDGEPGGLGWRPDGTLLVVSMRTRSVVAVDAAGAISTVADLSALTTGRCNDMVVDSTGAAYVGDFGYDLAAGAAPQPGVLVLVPVDGAPPWWPTTSTSPTAAWSHRMERRSSPPSRRPTD